MDAFLVLAGIFLVVSIFVLPLMTFIVVKGVQNKIDYLDAEVRGLKVLLKKDKASEQPSAPLTPHLSPLTFYLLLLTFYFSSVSA